ncbi:hypothetical protein C1A40_11995 [Tamlana carrageenivorans]|uniref:Uncharacterized protein n=2 Tax=Pseudotamlana carrageenivorans TaxID=2069432 RepID=A0A2I7SJQ4_9FLAO|nr:hypothetical protein C1A40_11995 [Tamlana carrageenivorans]
MKDDDCIDYKTFFIGLLVLSVIPLASIWIAYELAFNYDYFTDIDYYETSKTKLYKVLIQSIATKIPSGRYVAIVVHVLVAIPFLRWIYRLIKNTFKI